MVLPELVIFDCDGVIVDSEGIFAAVLAKSLTKYGVPTSPDYCLSHYKGQVMRDVMQQAIDAGAALPDGWISEVYAEVDGGLKRGTPVIDGIPELFDLLDRAEIPYCVASNGRVEKMDITLGQNGLIPRFKGNIFSAYAVGIAKPDPGLFLYAAEKMGIAPRAAVVIEDSKSGTLAAKRAGMRCFAYAPEGDGKDLTNHDAILIRSMRELPALLGLPAIPQ